MVVMTFGIARRIFIARIVVIELGERAMTQDVGCIAGKIDFRGDDIRYCGLNEKRKKRQRRADAKPIRQCANARHAQPGISSAIFSAIRAGRDEPSSWIVVSLVTRVPFSPGSTASSFT